MSLGGLRDPRNPARDTYSQLEADAVAYAVSKGVLVVAAVGNSDQSPSQPWPYASWPAALPHVLGVSALSRTGGSPGFSNRDPQFNDIAAPGEDILSTFPLRADGRDPDCVEQGYSSCGPEEYRSAEGTSFAAPQVTAAAAVLLATSPTLAPDQVAALLERSAVDAVPANGCGACAIGRDRFTGAGRLDQAAALELLGAASPPRDRYEPNDDGGASAYPLFGASRAGRGDARLLERSRRRLPRLPPSAASVSSPTLGTSDVGPARRSRSGGPGTETVDAASAPVRRLAARPPGAGAELPGARDRLVRPHVRVQPTARRRPSYRLAVAKSR